MDRRRPHSYLRSQVSDRETEARARFAAPNKLKHATERKSNHALGRYVDGLKNRVNIELMGTLLLMASQLAEIWGNGWYH